MQKPVPRIYVINLPRDVERRQTMRARLDQTGVAYEFIEAVYGKDLTPGELERVYDSKKRCRFFGRDMLPGEIGCLLSHRKIFEKMDAESIDYAVVLEDDVIFESDFKNVLQALVNTDVKWDVIRFLGSKKIYKRGCRKIAPLMGACWLARLPTAPGGAHGYLLTLKAARVMLSHMRRNWLPIDTLQGRTWETGLETLVVYPAPLHIDEQAGTTIGDARFDKTVRLTGFERALFPFSRAWFKISETAGKRAVFWGAWWRDTRRKA